jgi:hypothetical protein
LTGLESVSTRQNNKTFVKMQTENKKDPEDNHFDSFIDIEEFLFFI